MFRLAKPNTDEIRREIEIASREELLSAEFLASPKGLKVSSLPAGFANDRSRTTLGSGEVVYRAAIRALERWQNFDLGWVPIVNTEARIEPGQIVAVEVCALGLWSFNLSRIVQVIREPHAFGFIYKTTLHHVEEGEERFLLSLDPDSAAVWYDLEAVSRPRALLARLGFPITRAFHAGSRRTPIAACKELLPARDGLQLTAAARLPSPISLTTAC